MPSKTQTPKFRILEKVAIADIAFESYGKNLSELFENSAIATTSIMVDAENLSETADKKIFLHADDIEALLFDFLNELVFIKDTDGLLFRKFKIQITEKKDKVELEAILSGEQLNPDKHNLKIDIKAITLHLFKVEKKSSGYKATVVVDI